MTDHLSQGPLVLQRSNNKLYIYIHKCSWYLYRLTLLLLSREPVLLSQDVSHWLDVILESALFIIHTFVDKHFPGPIFYWCFSMILANQRRCYICNNFSHWLTENMPRHWLHYPGALVWTEWCQNQIDSSCIGLIPAKFCLIIAGLQDICAKYTPLLLAWKSLRVQSKLAVFF